MNILGTRRWPLLAGSRRTSVDVVHSRTSAPAPVVDKRPPLLPSSEHLEQHQSRPHHHLVTQDALTLLSMYISAIIHDYDHRGVTNAFLIQDEDPLAVSAGGERPGPSSCVSLLVCHVFAKFCPCPFMCAQLMYNDLSPMESHHLAAAFGLLRDPQNNFLGHLPRKVRPY